MRETRFTKTISPTSETDEIDMEIYSKPHDHQIYTPEEDNEGFRQDLAQNEKILRVSADNPNKTFSFVIDVEQASESERIRSINKLIEQKLGMT